jgi:hypothetical protein
MTVLSENKPENVCPVCAKLTRQPSLLVDEDLVRLAVRVTSVIIFLLWSLFTVRRAMSTFCKTPRQFVVWSLFRTPTS